MNNQLLDCRSIVTSLLYAALLALLSVSVVACDDGDETPAADVSPDSSADADMSGDIGDVDAEPDTDDAGLDLSADSDVGGSALPAPLRELVALLDEADAEDYDSVVEAWVAAQDGIPITSQSSALFIWLGDDDDVQMVGDASAWNPDASPTLVSLEYPGVDLFYLEQTYESNARLDYKFVDGFGSWNLDPLNDRTMAGGFGANSELAMPDYETPTEVIVEGAERQGTLTTHTLESTSMGDTRSFTVYVAPGADVATARPVVIFHDGGDFLSIIDTPVILDRVVATGDVGPLVAVFTPPIDRNGEYNRNDDYVSYLADELVPWIRTNLNAGQTPATTGTVGPSMGGLIACYTAISRPDVFGLGGCQSGAYSLNDDAMIDLVADNPKVDVRLHLVVGTYELSVGGGGDEGNLLEAQRRLVTALTDKAYDFDSEEHPQGHSWGLWRDRLPAALRFMYGTE